MFHGYLRSYLEFNWKDFTNYLNLKKIRIKINGFIQKSDRCSGKKIWFGSFKKYVSVFFRGVPRAFF